jgi:hypothetical protein
MNAPKGYRVIAVPTFWENNHNEFGKIDANCVPFGCPGTGVKRANAACSKHSGGYPIQRTP